MLEYHLTRVVALLDLRLAALRSEKSPLALRRTTSTLFLLVLSIEIELLEVRLIPQRQMPYLNTPDDLLLHNQL